MKIFLSYKQSWVDSNILKKELSYFKDKIQEKWDNIFIYYLDKEFENKNDILITVKEEIRKSDIFLCFINHAELSEWMLLELWIAYSLNKRIILLVNDSFKDEYFLSFQATTEIIYFDEIENLDLNKLIMNKW